MRFKAIDPPRVFTVGQGAKIHLKDCGRLELEPDEQVTFVTPSGTEYDVARKSWGYYATPSLNRRLPDFGLNPALVRSGDRLYLLLVEAGKEQEFEAYLRSQGMKVCRWLNQGPTEGGGKEKALACPICGSADLSIVFRYDAPPEGETVFQRMIGAQYYREFRRCRLCGHFLNVHQLDLDKLYDGAYVQSTYGRAGMLQAYRRITALPPKQSDNYHRVKRIIEVMSQILDGQEADRCRPPTVLDVGSGLCVFLRRMKEIGWDCTALDPDQGAADHARTEVGVKAICGEFMQLHGLSAFDLIAFNKVLEHVVDPVAMLRKSGGHLSEGGVVYVEVPDGEAAAAEGAGREEFFIEHVCAFSMTSLSLLAARAGFTVRLMERVREPSGKFTLRAFMQQ